MSAQGSLSLYRKISQLGIGLLLVVILLEVLFFNLHQSRQLLGNQIHILTNSLIRNQIASIRPVLATQNWHQLNQLLEDWQQDPLILGIRIFAADGTLQVASSNSLPVIERLRQQPDRDLLQLSRPIWQEGELIGFIRLTLDRQALTRQTASQQQDLQSQQHIMLLLAFLAGVMLTGAVNRLREALGSRTL